MNHPISMIRDTSYYYHITRNIIAHKSTTPSLKKLAREVLGLEIQETSHDSVSLGIFTSIH